MGYYNYSIVIYKNDINETTKNDLDSRCATSRLPGGAIPVALIDLNNKRIVEITNDVEKDVLFTYLQENFQEELEFLKITNIEE